MRRATTSPAGLKELKYKFKKPNIEELSCDVTLLDGIRTLRNKFQIMDQ